MSFASVSFLLFFLVVLLLLLLVQRVLPFAEIKRRIICQGILLIASYVFYGWWNMPAFNGNYMDFLFYRGKKR